MSDNSSYMLTLCPVACGVCKPKCKDALLNCSAWAHNGECDSNSAFMLKNCPLTCDVCTNATAHLKLAAQAKAAPGKETECPPGARS